MTDDCEPADGLPALREQRRVQVAPAKMEYKSTLSNYNRVFFF